MQTLRRRLRPLTWLALVAMLSLGLLPAVSHALAFAGGSGPWAGVCGARGMVGLAAGDGHPGTDKLPAAGTFEHCPYCAPAAGAVGPPPAPQETLPVLPADAAALGKRLVPAASAPWAPAQPRAPPTSPSARPPVDDRARAAFPWPGAGPVPCSPDTPRTHEHPPS